MIPTALKKRLLSYPFIEVVACLLEQASDKGKSMKVEKSLLGATPAGSPLNLYTLDNEQGLSIAVSDFGANLTRVYFPDREGHKENLVLAHRTIEDLLANDGYFGAIIGRYGNRIAEGRFSLDGHRYQLACNQNGHHLHGGDEGFNSRLWTFEKADNNSVTFSYFSPDGEEGYPGNLSVQVCYRLTQDNKLFIEYQASTDKATPLNLTNHSYWNLAGAGSGDILDHRLMLNCEHYLPVDESLIPTGKIAPVAGSPFDFRHPRTIRERIDETNGGYDHCFVQAADVLSTPREIARVEDLDSGRAMTVSTTEPGVQFYTGNFLDGVQGADGHVYDVHAAFCLETQHFPNSPNEPTFPNTILRPGETYRQTTCHQFSTVKPQ